MADRDWIGRREGAILRALSGISQMSDALRAGRRRESLSLLGGMVKIGCLCFLYTWHCLSFAAPDLLVEIDIIAAV